MEKGGVSRRRFIGGLSGTISTAWIFSNWIAILAAQDHVHSAISLGTTPELQFFTSAQAGQVEALTAQIIPADDTPGAKEAGAVYFIDRALAGFDKDRAPVYTKGLANLERASRKLFPRSGTFTDLKPDQQIKVMRAIEKSQFFDVLRTHTVISFMANPEYGGNSGKVGWKLIGFEDLGLFRPPFGFYDQMHNSNDGGAQ